MRKFLEDFRKFIMRGNVLDLAVAVVVGAAFNTVVQSFVNNILMQIIAIFGGKPSFNDLSFTVNKAEIRYGAFLTDLISFVIIAFAIFLVIKTFEKLQSLRQQGADTDTPAPSDEAVLLTEIRDLIAAQQR